MVCEICGSTTIRKEGGVFACLECGTEYSLEEARNLLQEVGNAPVAKAPPRQVEAAKEIEKAMGTLINETRANGRTLERIRGDVHYASIRGIMVYTR